MSRKFQHFPEEKICPVCNTNEDKPCILIPIPGTEEGNIMQATPMHYDCAYLVACEVAAVIRAEDEEKRSKFIPVCPKCNSKMAVHPLGDIHHPKYFDCDCEHSGKYYSPEEWKVFCEEVTSG
jgi:hypothetical protein